MYCVVCKFGSITLFSVQNSCHLLTRCIISPTGHKNISLLDKFHAGYIGCIVTCHVKCRLLACCILSGLDAHCVLLHRAASAQMTKYSPLVDIYRYHRSLEGSTKYCTRVRVQYFISPRGRQPEAEIFSYSTEGPTGPSAIRLFRPRGEDDIVYIHERALLECSCNATN